jgi:putative flippase GtrA
LKALFTKIGNFLRRVIDIFYPPFRHFFSIDFFRYGVCGGLNLLFDWVLFFLIFNHLLHQQMLNLGIVTLSSHIAAFIIKFPITLLSGFLLQKYVTFSYSVATKGRIQLLRYLFIVAVNLFVNYAGLKFFVEVIHLFPSIANVVVSIITVIVSYVGQKKFAFKN